MHGHGHGHSKTPSFAMALVAIGIIYGDIGTSPLYVMKAVLEGSGGLGNLNRDFIFGTLSMIFWTVTILTTFKYILIAIRADNHGEGSIFSLYSLVKKCGKYLLIPAMIGGATLLADCVLTPAVTVTTSVEGLRSIEPMEKLMGHSPRTTIIITLVIITVLFSIQRAGAVRFGKLFGPIMMIWFVFIAVVGLVSMWRVPGILECLKPSWAIKLVTGENNLAGIAIFGAVFLANTGAEAIYSDMGHVGRSNIYVTWPFVKLCLMINYIGQGAWMLRNIENAEFIAVEDPNPFFLMLPEELRPFAVVLALVAAIIASQAIITGSYTLVSEAITLDLMPHMRVQYPSDTKGQVYIGIVNLVSWIGCVIMVLAFETSSYMEATHGLTNIVTMLATSILLLFYEYAIKKRKVFGIVTFVFFAGIESVFCYSLMGKFMHGGYFALALALFYFIIMYIWRKGTAIEQRQRTIMNISNYVDAIGLLRKEESIPRCAENLVFFTNNADPRHVDREIVYSILDGEPKRADTYWIVNVTVSEKPYDMNYAVENYGTDYLYFVHFNLGFKVVQSIGTYLEQVAQELTKTGEYPNHEKKFFRYAFTNRTVAFTYCMIQKHVSFGSEISDASVALLTAKYSIRRAIGNQVQWYELDSNAVIEETIPMFEPRRPKAYLHRVEFEDLIETEE